MKSFLGMIFPCRFSRNLFLIFLLCRWYPGVIHCCVVVVAAYGCPNFNVTCLLCSTGNFWLLSRRCLCSGLDNGVSVYLPSFYSILHKVRISVVPWVGDVCCHMRYQDIRTGGGCYFCVTAKGSTQPLYDQAGFEPAELVDDFDPTDCGLSFSSFFSLSLRLQSYRHHGGFAPNHVGS